MKILLIDVNCKYSSTGKIVYDMRRMLETDGHDARVAYGRGSIVEEPGIYKFGVDAETYLHAGLARITGYNGCFSALSTRRLISYIEKFKPDIIHIHELHAYFVNVVQLMEYLKRRQIPIVWTFHCEYMYTGKCGVTLGCERYKTGCGKCPYLREYVGSLFFDHTRRMLAQKKKAMDGLNLQVIVTPSQWLADKTRETYLGNNKIVAINNGIDTDSVFYPRDNGEDLRARYDIPPDAHLILAVAPDVLDERKGGQILMDLISRYNDTNLHFFVLVGGSETKHLSPNALLISRTRDQNELAEWYSAADLFIILSRAETFPTTCMEALCCGTSIVGLSNGGIPETAEEPYGTFIPERPRDDTAGYEVMLTDLQKAISNKLALHLSPTDIRTYAVTRYDKSVMYCSYKQLYHSIVT